MDIQLTQLLAGVGQFLVVAVVAFGVYCLVMSALRFEALAERAAQGKLPADVAAQGAHAIVAARVAASPRAFSLLMVRVETSEGASISEPEFRQIQKALRDNVRTEDQLTPFDSKHLLMVLEASEANTPGVVARLRGVLSGEASSLPRFPVRLATASYPREQTSAAELIDLARTQIDQPPAEAPAAAPAPPRELTTTAPAKILDPLTGVLKADLVLGSMQKYLARLREAEAPFAVLHIDVDYMRRYNDQYGEERGNAVLKAMSHYLQRRVREDDLIGRGTGGDEFVIGLPLRSSEALSVAKRLCAALRRAENEARLDGLRVTVSIGVAAWPEHGSQARQLVASAEYASHQAKAKGRGMALMATGPANVSSADAATRDRL